MLHPSNVLNTFAGEEQYINVVNMQKIMFFKTHCHCEILRVLQSRFLYSLYLSIIDQIPILFIQMKYDWKAGTVGFHMVGNM